MPTEKTKPPPLPGTNRKRTREILVIPPFLYRQFTLPASAGTESYFNLVYLNPTQFRLTQDAIPWHVNGCLAYRRSLLGNLFSVWFLSHFFRTFIRLVTKFDQTFIALPFGAKLKDVFRTSFPCASHLPAAFCSFHLFLLLLIIAFFIRIMKLLSV